MANVHVLLLAAASGRQIVLVQANCIRIADLTRAGGVRPILRRVIHFLAFGGRFVHVCLGVAGLLVDLFGFFDRLGVQNWFERGLWFFAVLHCQFLFLVSGTFEESVFDGQLGFFLGLAQIIVAVAALFELNSGLDPFVLHSGTAESVVNRVGRTACGGPLLRIDFRFEGQLFLFDFLQPLLCIDEVFLPICCLLLHFISQIVLVEIILALTIFGIQFFLLASRLLHLNIIIVFLGFFKPFLLNFLHLSFSFLGEFCQLL